MAKEVKWEICLYITHKPDFKKLLSRLAESESYRYEVSPNKVKDGVTVQEVYITSQTTKELFALTHWLNTNINDVIY